MWQPYSGHCNVCWRRCTHQAASNSSEAIADYAPKGYPPEQLAERLRSHIDRTIIRRLRDDEGRLTIIEVTPRAVDLLIASEPEVALRLEQKRLLAELQRHLSSAGAVDGARFQSRQRIVGLLPNTFEQRVF